MKFLVVMHGESIVVFAKMPIDALDKRSEGRGFLFFTIFLSYSKNKFFDDFLQFHGRQDILKNFYVVQGFLLRVLVFKFFCKLFNFFVRRWWTQTCSPCFYSKQQTRREKPIQQKQKAGIVTSLNDTTLTKVTYGKYASRVPDELVYGVYEWFSSQ